MGQTKTIRGEDKLGQKNECSYCIIKTQAGWMGLSGSEQGLSRMTLPLKSKDEARQALGKEIDQAEWRPQAFSSTVEQIQAYFNGELTEFNIKLDLSKASAFNIQVWKATQSIPYGQKQSYRWVAQQIDKPQATRAVGNALGKNPIPIIIPCHRVVGSDGSLRGFRGGLEMKRYLLDLESAKR
jgi:O-6-methylguanine DNA methyltransferase